MHPASGRCLIRTFSDPAELVHALQALQACEALPAAPVIGIDGVKGSGKTTLARYLATHMDAGLISLDAFLADRNVSYEDRIERASLKEKILVLKMCGQALIVEGFCLLSVLEAIDVRPDLLVYVKRVWEDGRPFDADLLSDEVTEERMLGEIAEWARGMGIEDADPLLERDAVRYHKRVRPQEKAFYVYETVFPEFRGA